MCAGSGAAAGVDSPVLTRRGAQRLYGSEFSTVARPYAFIQFDNFLQKIRKQYDSRGVAKNLEKVNAELIDVQRIMVRNIDEVLQRGNLVSGAGAHARARVSGR